MSVLRCPVLDPKVSKTLVVREVERSEDEVVRPRYGRDLPVRERRGPAVPSQAGAFGDVPPYSGLVVRQDLDGRGDDPPEVLLDRLSPLGGRRPITTEQQLVPDDRSGGQLVLMSSKPIEDSVVRLRTQRLGDDVGVELVPTHRRASRLGEVPRTPSKTSGSMPRRGRSVVSRNLRYASQNFSLPAARRRYSPSESMTASGSPQRVNSMWSRLSNSCTMAARSCLASAMEYLLDTARSLDREPVCVARGEAR